MVLPPVSLWIVMLLGGRGVGFGVYWRRRWCAAPWPKAWHEPGFTKDLTYLNPPPPPNFSRCAMSFDVITRQLFMHRHPNLKELWGWYTILCCIAFSLTGFSLPGIFQVCLMRFLMLYLVFSFADSELCLKRLQLCWFRCQWTSGVLESWIRQWDAIVLDPFKPEQDTVGLFRPLWSSV